MSHSFIGADRWLHLKIIGIGAVFAVIIVLFSFYISPSETRMTAVLKAGKPVTVSQSVTAIRE